MSTGRVAVTVKQAWFSISRRAGREGSSTHSVDARPARRWPRALGALWLVAGLWAFPYDRAWGQTASGVLGLRQGDASVLAEQLQRFAAAKETLTPSQQKVDSHLRRLAWPAQAEAQTLAPPLVPPPWQQGAWLHVYAYLHATTQDVLDELRARGLAIERVNDDFAVAQGWIMPADLPGLADLDVVVSIAPVLPGFPQVGAVTSEGDMASRANLVRAQGYNGTGVTVGVISDGIDSLATAQATGDLGSVIVPPGCQAGSGDEGTAMLEIVHDLAPGAALLFSSDQPGSLAFINSVNCLRAAGATVIVDDVALFDQPFFQDGPAAMTVRTAVQGGVSYFTSAGNYALRHVEQQYCPGSGGLHDFNCGAGVLGDVIAVPPGATLDCFLQWNDPFPGSANNYDLAVFDAASGTLVDMSTNVQNGTQYPLEHVHAVNGTGITAGAVLAIRLTSGQPRLLDLYCPEPNALVRFSVNIPSSSIFGHAAVPEVVTAAAIDVMIPGLTTIEPFSTQGPVNIFFPASETRPKPDIAGFDDVSTTLSGFSPFFGTSAAAPHVAAVAALLLSKNPFLAPAQIQSTLRTAAIDIGTSGFDYVAGAGRLDALAAENAVAPPCPSDAACNDGNPCNGVETCRSGMCVAGTPLNCDDANPCTADACNPTAGCQHTPAANGTVCSGGDACTVGNTCQAGICTGGTAVNCDDGDACTTDTCDPVAGCQHTPVADPTTCSTLIPGGGPVKSDCYALAAVEGMHSLKNAKTLECADGDPTCDKDGRCNNVCALRLHLCINSPRISGCAPPSQLQSLQFKSHPATFTLNGPGRHTGAQCTARQDVNLPVKVNKKGKKSTGVFMVTATAKGPKGTKPPKDSDTYVLKCVPGCTP
jgi:subtilisin family serine protease